MAVSAAYSLRTRVFASPLRQAVVVRTRGDGLIAASTALDVARRLGLSRPLSRRLAIITGEIATNLCRDGGGVVEMHLHENQLEVAVHDRTPASSRVRPFASGWDLERVRASSDRLDRGRDVEGRAWIKATLSLDTEAS